MNNNQLSLILNRHIRNIRKIKKISAKIDMKLLDMEKIKEILKKTTDKGLTEISALKYYCINKTNIIAKFEEDKLDETSYDLILSLSLSSSSLKTVKKNNVVINIGNPCDYLYIILEGKAALFGIKKFHIDVTAYEYFLLLRDLKKNKDNYLLEKTVAENYRIYPIDYEDIIFLEKIVLKIFLSRKFKRTSPKYLELILDKVGMKHSDFNLETYYDMVEKKYKDVIDAQEDIDWSSMKEEEKIEKYKELMIYDINDAWNYTLRNEKKINDQLEYIDTDLMKKYNYLTKMKDEELVTIYKCQYLNDIEENEYFGNSEHKLYINKVIALTEELNLMCIKSDLYLEYVRKVNYKVIGSQINFLLDNFYFHPLYKGFFEKYYFKYFELVEYKIKQIIVKENDPVHYVYFIKNGSVKLTSNRSIAENHILIELIKNILLKSDNEENKKKIKSYMNDLYNNVTNNLEYFSNDMNIKNQVHIMTLQSNNCIGSACAYYGFNYLYTAEVNSEVVELYKISIDKIMRIVNDKTSKVYYYYIKHSEDFLKLFFNRLTRLNNMLLANLNKSKIRQYGDIFNLNVENFQDSIYKNDIKFTNKMDKLSFDTLMQKNKTKGGKGLSQQNLEKEKEKINEKINIDINNINSKLFITQKSKTPNYHKLSRNLFPKNEKKKSQEDITQKIIDNLKRSNSYNLFPMPKDSTKDMTSHIKFFDYRENLEKQKEKEEIRARNGLVLLEKKEKKQMEKLKRQTQTFTNWFKLSLGNQRSLIAQYEQKDIEENGYNSFSSNNNIFGLYNRDVFRKNRMLVTSLYKNKFSEYFDTKLGAKNFKYDMSRTLLSNKKKFEYSIFDQRFTNNFRSAPKKRTRYKSLRDIKKNENNKNIKAKTIDILNKYNKIQIIPNKSKIKDMKLFIK